MCYENHALALLFYVMALAGFIVFMVVYFPASLGFQILTQVKNKYERFLETFDGWM